MEIVIMYGTYVLLPKNANRAMMIIENDTNRFAGQLYEYKHTKYHSFPQLFHLRAKVSMGPNRLGHPLVRV